MNLLVIGKLLFQLGDFAVKAITSYADTDEGQKEWGDVVGAFVELDLFNPSDVAQDVTVSSKEDSEKPLTAEEITRLSETFNKPEEQADGVSVAPKRVVHRMSMGGGARSE